MPMAFFAAGLSLFGFGAQRLLAAVIMVPASPIVAAMEEQRSVSTEQLDALILAQTRSLAVLDTPRGWSNLGTAYALKSMRLPAGDPNQQRLLQQSMSALTRSLLDGPCNPYVWERLAAVQAYDRNHADIALRYHDLSIETGQNEPTLYGARIAIGATLWPYMVDSERAALFIQMRQAWHYDRWPFIDQVVKLNATGLARSALSADAGDLSQFDKMAPVAPN